MIDDASPDDSAGIIRRWQQAVAMPRFTLLSLPRNVGFSGAVTTGLFLARGEYIAIHDADDYSHKDRIRRQVEFLESHPHISMVGTNYLAFADHDPGLQVKSNWLRYGEEIPKSYAAGEHCVSHPTILFRGEVFDRLGGLTRNMEGAEDFEFIARCVSNRVGVENLPDILYYYRSHQAQRSRAFYPS